MKTLKTDINGGFPFELDDLRWIESGIKRSFETAAKTIGDTFLIQRPVLTITPSGGGFDITHMAGRIFTDGEFCDIDLLSVALFWNYAGGDVCWFEKVIEFDPTGNETFEDSSVHDTYQRTVWKLNTGASAPGGSFGLFDLNSDLNSERVLLNKLLPLKFIHGEAVQFANASAPVAISNGADGGLVTFPTNDGNAEVFTFNSPVVDIYCMDQNSADTVGMWRMIKFVASGTPKTVIVRHNSSGTAGTNFKFKCPCRVDRLFYDGDVGLFYNDGSFWVLVSGGRPVKESLNVIGYTGTWNYNIGTPTVYKDAENRVHLEGLVINSNYTTTTDDQILTLPVRFRPEVDSYFNAVVGVAGVQYIGGIVVTTSGNVLVSLAGQSGVIATTSLSHVSFMAKN